MTTTTPEQFSALYTEAQRMLRGGSPNGAHPEIFGEYWGSIVEPMYSEWQQGGTIAVKRYIQTLITYDKRYAGLLAAPPAAEPVDSLDMPALPESAHIDEAIGADACQWLDDYITFSRRWSPRSYDGFHEAVAIWVLSTIAARRVVTHLGKPQYTPLFIALAGRSSIHAKTTCADIGVSLLRDAGLGWLLADDSSTPQKFIQDRTIRLPDDYKHLSGESLAEAHLKIAFAGQCGWWYDEFGMLLHSMARQGSVMADWSGLLRRFDDCAPTYSHGTIGRKTDKIIAPYLALLASLTPADLRPLMRRGAAGWSDGFWSRWIFVTPPADEVRTDRFPAGERIMPVNLIRPLRQWHNRLGVPSVRVEDDTPQVEPLPRHVCDTTPDVIEAYYRYDDALHELIVQSQREDLDSTYARFPIKALRVAALLASLENNGVIELRHWARAQHIAERWRASLHRIYAQTNISDATPQRDNEDDVLRTIERLGNPSRRDLKTRLPHLSHDEIQSILDNLVRLNMVVALNTGKTVRYRISADDDPVAGK